MAAQKSIYRRLPGRGTTLSSYARLYQAPDHFLQVSSTGYSETYKRFYFRDIQAIIIRKSKWWFFWTFLWLSPAVAFAMGALGSDGGTAAVFWSISGALLLGLTINLFLGPTCACQVQTAVQTENLPSLKRLRKTRKLLNRIKPLIAAVQGELSAQELAARRAGVSPAAEPRLEGGAIPQASGLDEPRLPQTLVAPPPDQEGAGPDNPANTIT